MIVNHRLHAPHFFFSGFDDFFSTPVLTDASLAPFIISTRSSSEPPDTDSMVLRRTSPCYEVTENEKEFQLSVDVPGVKANDIHVELEEGGRVLKLSGARHIRKSLSNGTTKSYESKFEKRFTMDRTIDTNKLVANLSDGVLVITAPKDPHRNGVVKIPILEGPVPTTGEGVDAIQKESKRPVENSRDGGYGPKH